LSGFLLQRVLHLQSGAGSGAFGPERDTRFRLIALEGDRSDVDIHGSHVHLARYVIDHALPNGFFAFAGAIAANQGAGQEGEGGKSGKKSHRSIIPFDRMASIKPLSSKRLASAATSMPSLRAVA